MKKLIAITSVIIFLSFAFITGNINPFDWTIATRAAFVVILFTVNLFIVSVERLDL